MGNRGRDGYPRSLQPSLSTPQPPVGGPHLVGILPARRPRNPTRIRNPPPPLPTPTSRRDSATTWVMAGGELGGGVRIPVEPRRGGKWEERETWTPSGSLPRCRCPPQCRDLGNPPVLGLGNHFPVWWWGRCPEGGAPDDASRSTRGPWGTTVSCENKLVVWVPFRSQGTAAARASRWLLAPVGQEGLGAEGTVRNTSVGVGCTWGLLA